MEGGLRIRKPNRDSAWWSCGSQDWCSLTRFLKIRAFFFFPQQFALPGFIRLYGRRSGVRRGTVRVRQVRYVEEGADINRCSQQTVWLNQVYGLRLHRDG